MPSTKCASMYSRTVCTAAGSRPTSRGIVPYAAWWETKRSTPQEEHITGQPSRWRLDGRMEGGDPGREISILDKRVGKGQFRCVAAGEVGRGTREPCGLGIQHAVDIAGLGGRLSGVHLARLKHDNRARGRIPGSVAVGEDLGTLLDHADGVLVVGVPAKGMGRFKLMCIDIMRTLPVWHDAPGPPPTIAARFPLGQRHRCPPIRGTYWACSRHSLTRPGSKSFA